jgi:hypothetical protein
VIDLRMALEDAARAQGIEQRGTRRHRQPNLFGDAGLGLRPPSPSASHADQRAPWDLLRPARDHRRSF